MKQISSLFPLSINSRCVIFASFSLCSSLIMNISGFILYKNYEKEFTNRNYTETKVSLMYSMEERLSQGYIKIKTMELLLRLVFLLLILNAKGVIMYACLIYIIAKKKHKYFISWLLTNAVRVICISAVVFYISAVFLSLGTKKYQMASLFVLILTAVYVYIQVKFSTSIYKAYSQIKNESSSRLRFKKTLSQQTINRSVSSVSVAAMELHNSMNMGHEQV